MTGTVSGPGAVGGRRCDRGARAVVAPCRRSTSGSRPGSCPVPAVSPTVWLPVFRSARPSSRRRRRSLASGSVLPSICRLNLPGSVFGLEVLADLELARLAGVRDHADDVGVRRDRDRRAARRLSLVGARPRSSPVPLSSLQTIDFGVLGQVGPDHRGLPHRVAAGVQRLLAGRSAVAHVLRACVRGAAVDLQVEPARCRSLGLRSFCTSSLPVSRVLVIVQTMSEPVVTLTSSGAALSAADAGRPPSRCRCRPCSRSTSGSWRGRCRCRPSRRRCGCRC